ncbi:hypothetical protein STENM327S_02708 [Streptomyces tendae]
MPLPAPGMAAARPYPGLRGITMKRSGRMRPDRSSWGGAQCGSVAGLPPFASYPATASAR